MLKINLLKRTAGKKRSGQSTNNSRYLLYAVIGAILLGTGTFFFISPKKRVKSETQTVVQNKDAPPRSAANVVEEVVREVGASKSSSPGFLDIAYSDMAFNERITYEVLYTKKVLEMLSRTFPEGIGLKKLEISKFQTVYAVGLGDTKEIISQTFTSLRKERLELLPKPYSFITSNGKGYRFNVTLKTEFGLDFADRFQAIDHLVSREFLDQQVKKVTLAAERSEVKFKTPPKQLSVENVGGYRRYIYNIRADATYKDFVRFIMDLYNEQVPCAFKEVKIEALSGSGVSVDAELLITVKNN